MRKPKLKLKLGNRHKVRMEIALYLMERYAPEATLKCLRQSPRTKRGKRTSYLLVANADSSEPNTIHWALENGLTALLHEIGHHRIEGRANPKKGMEEVIAEAIAWRWAEWAAGHENLWFDYDGADRAFASYTKRMPIKINWRKRDVFS